MFGINLSSISMLSTVALGPVGGLAAQLGTQIFAGMGQQLLQGMGERLNLPQSVIDLETAGFSAQTGDIVGGLSGMRDSISALGQETRAGLADIQTQQQDTEDALHQILDNLAQSPEVKEIRENGGRGGGSWLRAMADALGKKLDALADEMNDLANKITKSDPSTTTDFTVASQEFNMLMSATTNAIKTVGEAMGKSASRQ